MNEHSGLYSHWTIVLIAVTVGIIMTVGVIGNVTVCLVFYRVKRLQTAANALVVNLAVADILQSLNMAFIITSAVHEGWPLGKGMCQLMGFTNMSFIGTSLNALALIGLNRYLTIVKNKGRTLFMGRNLALLIAFSWIYPALLAIAPVLGWSAYNYQPGKLMCTLRFSDSYSFSITTVLVVLMVPFITIAFCYWEIVKAIRASNRRVAVLSVSTRRRQEENKIAGMLVVVVISFVIFYMPASAVNFIQMGKGSSFETEPWIDTTTVIFAMLNHVNNPIIYGLMNPNYRNAFREFVSRKPTVGNTVVATVQTNLDRNEPQTTTNGVQLCLPV